MEHRIVAFGKTGTGEETHLYILENQHGMQMKVTDYGAVLVSVIVQGRDGKARDVLLGYDSATGYESDRGNMGACVGRCANRIGGAEFELNGIRYALDANEGKNCLHSGWKQYGKRVWSVEHADTHSITMSLFSPHMDQGYPGNVTVRVTYTLTDEDEVLIDYTAEPDADTILNLTNHSYFNLAGHESGSVLDQIVWIDANGYTETDEGSISTGKIIPVRGTPLDFTVPKRIGSESGGDYDSNYVLNGEGYRKVASIASEESGIQMDVYTDLPGMQFYTAAFLDVKNGKAGMNYGKYAGACFESQYFPDAVHHENFEGPVCRKGEAYVTRTGYCFKLSGEECSLASRD